MSGSVKEPFSVNVPPSGSVSVFSVMLVGATLTLAAENSEVLPAASVAATVIASPNAVTFAEAGCVGGTAGVEVERESGVGAAVERPLDLGGTPVSYLGDDREVLEIVRPGVARRVAGGHA